MVRDTRIYKPSKCSGGKGNKVCIRGGRFELVSGVLGHVFESGAMFGRVSLMVAQLTFVKVRTRLVSGRQVGRKSGVMVLING